ncbi:hypothetical protein FQZ97_733320 [compost metagenome]
MLRELRNLKHCNRVCKIATFSISIVEALTPHTARTAWALDLRACINYRLISRIVAAVPNLLKGIASTGRAFSTLYAFLGDKPAVGIIFINLARL